MNRNEAISELMSLIASVKRAMQGHAYPCQDGTSLTGAQLGILFALKHHGPIPAHQLSERLSLTPGGVSQLVEGLVERGFIHREPRDDDRRTHDLSLSPIGLKQTNSIERKRHAVLRQVTAELSDKELESLVSMHQKLLAAIKLNIK